MVALLAIVAVLPTNMLPLNELSRATVKLALKDTSPALTMVPVNDGAAIFAFKLTELVNPEFIIVPFTNRLPLNDESEATRAAPAGFYEGPFKALFRLC